MRMILSSAALAALVATAAIAQTPAPPPPAGPTAQECDKGWHEGLPWTKQAFLKACEELRKQSKP